MVRRWYELDRKMVGRKIVEEIIFYELFVRGFLLNLRIIANTNSNEYEEICDKSRRAKLHNNKLNSSLLNALENIKFISSYKEDDKDKNFLRVYHKSQHK